MNLLSCPALRQVFILHPSQRSVIRCWLSPERGYDLEWCVILTSMISFLAAGNSQAETQLRVDSKQHP